MTGLLEKVADLDGAMTKISLVEGNEDIIGDDFASQTIDVSDMEAFGNDDYVSSSGMISHAIEEQYQKQVNGVRDYSVAHKLAIQTENAVNGSVRGDQLNSSMFVRKDHNTILEGIIDFRYTKNGKSATVHLFITNDNITKVRRYND